MDDKIRQAYDKLTPKDQLIVDAVIVTLYEKYIEIDNCVKEVRKFLDKKE